MNKILILNSHRKKCGVKDYTLNLIANFPGETKKNVVEKPISLINLLKSAFGKYKIIHIQHEFFLFDPAIGVTFLPILVYLWLFSKFFKYQIFLTIHSVYEPSMVEKTFSHFAKYTWSFGLLKFYLKIYYHNKILLSS